MNLKRLLLMTGELALVIASQHVVAFPSGKFIFGEDTEKKQSVVKAAPKKVKKGNKQTECAADRGGEPCEGFLLCGFNSSSQSAVKAAPRNGKQNIAPGKTKGKSQAEKVAARISELQGKMQRVADEIKALEISKKIGSDVTPIACWESPFLKVACFYAGCTAEYAWIGVKNKISANKRTIRCDEQKVNYFALVSSILHTVQKDEQGNIKYGDDGLPIYEKQPEPKDDDRVKSYYEQVTEDNVTYMKLKGTANKEELKKILKEKVDEFLKKLNILEDDASGKPTIKYTTIEIGDNKYSAIDKEGNNANPNEFYFGNSSKGTSHNNILTFVDGMEQLDNLCWANLIFTNYHSTKEGHHVTLLQAMGEYTEQTFGGQQTVTVAGIPGVYTTMASSRYTEEAPDGTKNDKFEKTAELDAIDEQAKTHKPSLGTSVFFGYGGISGKMYCGLELSAGYSHLNTKIIQRSGVIPTNQTDFANGNVEYVNKNEVIYNPVRPQETLGKVYDPATGKVRPVYVSGMGRQAGATVLSLPNFNTAYDISVRKSVNFSITPIIGFAHINTIYYMSFGFTYNRYEVKIQPNTDVLTHYADAVPIPYINGHMENFKGSSYLHEYISRLNDKGVMVENSPALGEESSKLPGLEAIYPSAVIETNADGEKNTFSGLRIVYPHYDDGGISVVGEASERPWLDANLSSKALSVKKVKKFRFGFKLGVGVKTFLCRDYFIELRYSFQFRDKITVRYDEFAAYPVHAGRANMKHRLKMNGHEIRIGFGRTF